MRCKKCVIPQCVPGSEFDENGVCSWCRTGFPNYKPLGVGALKARLESGFRKNSDVDCIVGVSGGKDSSFALWAMKHYFGLRVEAFTYDHAGVTQEARDNVRSVCSALGVPLTVTSLGNDEHRRSFRDYFGAFIDRPTNITAGMSCVACKHLHLFGTELAVKRGAPFVVWAKCPLEDSPFLALKPIKNSTSREGLIKGGMLLAGEVMRSRILLSAILQHFTMTGKGCLAFSPTSSYMKMRYPSVQQIPIFEYWQWDPKLIYATLERAGWKKPTSVHSDWHSDCDFHPIKEYMFQKILGVSYTDGFLSNQVRAGLITRVEALKELAISKRHFAKALPASLAKVGLEYFANQIDPSCFTASCSDFEHQLDLLHTRESELVAIDGFAVPAIRAAILSR